MSILTKVMLMSMFTTLIACAEPQVNVPYTNRPPKIDGTRDSDEWDQAAIIRNICTKSSSNAPQASAFYLQYDNENLYIFAHLEESEKGYPKAYARRSNDDLTLDDAIQIVLGINEQLGVPREVLTMGGYEGALNAEVSAADIYYQFTVNGVGAKSRAYNENLLDRPAFYSAVALESGGWNVECAIPFSSWGFESPEGKVALANFFRFRPPQIMAWHLPDLPIQYNAMPLGKICFLPKESTGVRTDEKQGEFLSEDHPSSDNSNSALLLAGELEYYPLSGVIAARVHFDQEVPKGKVLLYEGETLLCSWPLTASQDQKYLYNISAGNQPERKLSLVVLDNSGNELIRQSRVEKPVIAPEWLGTTVGMEYLKDRVPAPWSYPKVSGTSIKLSHSQITMGNNGLFSSITDEFGEMLGGDVKVDVHVDGKAIDISPKTVNVRQRDYYVETEGESRAGQGTLQIRSKMDYDGFTEVKMRLNNISANLIEKVVIRIPLQNSVAKYVHQVFVQKIYELAGFGFETHDGPLWVGNQEKGINFSYDDIDPFLSKDPRSRVKVVEDKNLTWLEITLVDAAGQVKEDGHVFRFFLQPTPTKPVSLTSSTGKVEFKWEQWATKEGDMQFEKIPEIKEWTTALKKEGKVGAIYTTHGLAMDSDDFKKYSSDLALQPLWMCYQRMYEPGFKVPVYGVCRRGPDGDRMLYGLKKFIDEAGIGGICDDGMSLALPDNNISHPPGCGNHDIPQWSMETKSRVILQRNFLKRVRGLFNNSGRPFYLSAHAGGGLEIATLSFFDTYMEGEQLARFRPGYHIPSGLFSVGYSGWAWGFRTLFWDKTWRKNHGHYWSYIYSLLHGMDYEDSKEIYEICKDFEKSPAKFFPYWRSGPDVSISSSKSKCSYFINASSALVVVGNLSYNNDHVAIDLTRLFPDKPIRVVNVLANNEPLVVPNNRVLFVSLDSYKGCVYRIDVHENEDPARVNTAKAPVDASVSKWRPDCGKGATIENTVSAKGLPDGFSVKTTIFQDKAVILWNSESKLNAFSGSILVNHENRIILGFGETEIIFDGVWQISKPSGGYVYNPEISVGKTVKIQFSLNDGKLDLVYDGKPLARNISVGSIDDIHVGTWGGDAAHIQPEAFSNVPVQLFEPLEGKDLTFITDKPIESMKSPGAGAWQTLVGSKEYGAKTTSSDSISVESTSISPASAILTEPTFGDNASLVLKIKHSGRIAITIGGVGFLWDSAWQLVGETAGWSQGVIYQPAFPLENDSIINIDISNGIWSVSCNGQLLFKDVEFRSYQHSDNRLMLKCWAGDRAEVKLKRADNSALRNTNFSMKHPIQ